MDVYVNLEPSVALMRNLFRKIKKRDAKENPFGNLCYLAVANLINCLSVCAKVMSQKLFVGFEHPTTLSAKNISCNGVSPLM